MRRWSSRRLVGLLATFGVALGADACGVIAGIEDFHYVRDAAVSPPSVDADLGDAGGGSDVGVGPSDAGLEGAVSDASVDGASDAASCACTFEQTCIKGTCYPEPILTGLTGPFSMAVVGDRVVVADQGTGSLVSVSTSGAASQATLATGLPNPLVRRGRGTNTLINPGVASPAPIQTVLADGGLGTLVSDAGAGLNAATVGLDAIVWGATNTIYQCGRSGSCAAGTPTLVATASSPVTGPAIEVVGSRVYWTPPGASGIVRYCDVGSCATPSTITTNGIVRDIDADDTGLVVVGLTSVQMYDATPTLIGTSPGALGGGRAVVIVGGSAFVASLDGVSENSRTAPLTSALRYQVPAAAIAYDAANSMLYWMRPNGTLVRAPR